MNLLTTLFRKDDRFLLLLEGSVGEACTGLETLQRLLNGQEPDAALRGILESRDRGRAIREEIEELLCQGAVAPMDREEIELLARALDGILRGVKKFATRYEMCAPRLTGASFGPQAEKLEQAVHAVRDMVAGLRRPNLAPTKRLHDSLQRIEGEADKLFIRLLADLQKRNHDPVAALMLRDLYELLERAVDRCRTAGNIVLRMVLKHT